MDIKAANHQPKGDTMPTNFSKLFRSMPIVLVGSGCDDATTTEELLDCAQTQVDIAEEGNNDGAMSPAETKTVRRWIACNL